MSIISFEKKVLREKKSCNVTYLWSFLSVRKSLIHPEIVDLHFVRKDRFDTGIGLS